MIELVFLGSLTLLGLHFLTRGRISKPTRPLPRPSSEKAPSKAEGFDFEIVYEDAKGAERQDRIVDVRHERSGNTVLIHCRSEDAGGGITLDNGKILTCRNLRSGRAIKDLARYCQARAAKR